MEKIGVITTAKKAGVSQFTIRAFVRKRQIPYYRIGKRIIFDAEEIDAWIATRRVPEKK